MSRWSIKVHSSPSSDTQSCVIVSFDTARYIFNMGENATRSFVQARSGFKKTKAVFLSGINTERCAGLPGFLMSYADSGSRAIAIHGPLGLAHFLASARLYTARDTLSMNLIQIPPISSSAPEPIFKDEFLKVLAVPVLPEDYVISESMYPLIESPKPLPSKRKRPSFEGSHPLAPPAKKGELASKAIVTPVNDAAWWQLPGFEPSNLTGSEAEAWRSLIVGNMFPGRAAPLTEPNVTPGNEQTLMPTSPRHAGYRPRRSNPSKNPKRLPSFPRLPLAVSYLCIGPEVRGKFDAKRAEELGVKGADRKKLTQGQAVVGSNGTTVTPEMVIAPSIPPTAFFFVDCPDLTYISGLISSSQFEPFKRGGTQKVHCIYHCIGEGVLEDVRYQEWMASFDPEVYHLISSEKYCKDLATFTGSAYTQLRLSALDSDLFRIPKYSLQASKELSSVHNLPPRAEVACAGQVIGMHPPSGPHSKIPASDYFHPEIAARAEGRTTIVEQPEIEDAFRDAKEVVATLDVPKSQAATRPGDNIVVTTLGTGSASPSKYRNVSATLVQIPGKGSFLLDCGEGTVGQLARHFDPSLSAENDLETLLRDLRFVFISHNHADHHIGLSRLLAKRRALDPAPECPIYVIGPSHIFLYLNEFNDLQDVGMDDPQRGVCPITADYLLWTRDSPSGEFEQPRESSPDTVASKRSLWETARSSQLATNELCETLGLASIQTVEVQHRVKAFGVVVKHEDGWSIVYSGDTKPTGSLVHAGKGATLLIHEATMADDQEELAKYKGHSTSGQAISIGKQMKAEKILLTHFSNRYPKVPSSIGTDTPGGPIVAVAFDFASYRLRDMWKMQHYIPAIERYFDLLERDDDDSGTVAEAEDT